MLFSCSNDLSLEYFAKYIQTYLLIDTFSSKEETSLFEFLKIKFVKITVNKLRYIQFFFQKQPSGTK